MTDRGKRHVLGCPLRRWSAMGIEHCICAAERAKVSGSMLERVDRLAGELKTLASHQADKPHRQEEYLYLSQRLTGLHDGHLLDQAKEDWPLVYKSIDDSVVVPPGKVKLPHGVLPTAVAADATEAVDELDRPARSDEMYGAEIIASVSGELAPTEKLDLKIEAVRLEHRHDVAGLQGEIEDIRKTRSQFLESFEYQMNIDQWVPKAYTTQAALLSAVSAITKNTDEIWETLKLLQQSAKQNRDKRENDSETIHQELTRQGLLQVAHGENVSGESMRLTFAHEKIEAVEKRNYELKELMELLRTELVETALRAEAKANDSLNQMNQVRNVVGGDIEPRVHRLETSVDGDIEPRLSMLASQCAKEAMDGHKESDKRLDDLERELAGLAGKVYGPK